MDEGVVEGGVDVRDAEDDLTLASLRAKGHLLDGGSWSHGFLGDGRREQGSLGVGDKQVLPIVR